MEYVQTGSKALKGIKPVLLVVLLLPYCFVEAESRFNSLDVMQESLSFSCIDFKPTGVCFWLKCNAFPPSCTIKTSLKIRHYNPDAIVQVYQNPGDTPWKEMSFVSELLTLRQSGSTPASGQDNLINKQTSKVINRHVDIIGSPGLLMVSAVLSAGDFYCGDGVTPFIPYYVSTLDYFSWKYPYAEFLKAGTWVPGMREVGDREDGENENFLFTGRFGNVYPRIGALIQNDTYKASAVFAQRAADIVTDRSPFHLRMYLGDQQSKDGYEPPGQVKEWTSDAGKWQMLYPRPESQCHIFGESSTRRSHLVLDGYSHKRSKSGDYAWQLWRPYECCKKAGQKLLFEIEF